MKSNTRSDNSATNSPSSDKQYSASGGQRSPKFTLPEMICQRDKFHSVDQRSFTMKIVEGIDVTSQATVTANQQNMQK